MSFQQRGIWFFEQLNPGTSAYHVPLSLEFPAARDPQVLEAALAAVVAHHPALRTTFAFDDLTFEPIQRVHARLPLTLETSDLSGLAAAGERLRELGEGHATAPFDLEQGPLLRAQLVALPGQRQRLLLTLHHLIADGWSLHLLIRDLESAYQALAQGDKPALQHGPRHYHDWSAWQRELAGDGWRPHLDYYREVLRGVACVPPLPPDRPRPAAPSLAAGRYDWTVPGEALAQAHARARQSGTTLYAVLLAALALVLHRRSGQQTVTIGTPMANRANPVLHEVIGYFVNVGVVPLAVTPDSTLASLLPQAHRRMLGALSFQDLPFERLVEDQAPARSRSVHPIFQVMLALQNTPDAWQTEQLHQPTGAAKFDLTFNAVESPNGLGMDCVYPAELYDHATVVSLCSEFTSLLAADQVP